MLDDEAQCVLCVDEALDVDEVFEVFSVSLVALVVVSALSPFVDGLSEFLHAPGSDFRETLEAPVCFHFLKIRAEKARHEF